MNKFIYACLVILLNSLATALLAQPIIDKVYEINICKGDTILAPPPPPPFDITRTIFEPPPPPNLNAPIIDAGANPYSPIRTQVPYTCYYDKVEIMPNEDRIGKLYPALFPSVSEDYLITYSSVETDCDTNSKSTYTIQLKIKVGCDARYNPINNGFKWLAKLTEDFSCHFISIDLYEKNQKKYVYVDASDGKRLYYEDGSVICNDDTNTKCLNLYDLETIIQSWSCNQEPKNNDTKTTDYPWISSTNEAYDVCIGEVGGLSLPYAPPPPPRPAPLKREYLFAAPIPQPGDYGPSLNKFLTYYCDYDSFTVFPNRNWRLNLPVLYPYASAGFLTTFYVTDKRCGNQSQSAFVKVNLRCSAKNNPISKNYPWLSNQTNQDNCEFSIIEEFEKNDFTYIYVDGIEGQNLYYQDGSLLCQNEPDYNCIQAYQLTHKIKSWSCNQTAIENPIEETPSTFNTYTWLSDFVNLDACNGESVYVYDADTYEFLIVKTNQGESIYKTNGELICFSPADGFSFIGLYNESRILDSWACEQGFQGRESKPILQNQGVQIFPNPTKDKVFINLQQLTFDQPVISIYDVQGKRVKQITSAEAFAGIVQLNVGDLHRGIYLVEVRTNENIITEKLLIK